MKKNKKVIIAVIIALLVVLCGAVVAYALFFKDNSVPSNINLSPATEEQKKAGEDTKDKYVTEGPDAPDTTVKDPEPIEIIKAYQDNSIGKIVVQTKLPGSSWESCNLKLASPNGVTIEKNAKAFYQPDYSTCEGFSIDRTEFNQAGIWTILLTAKKIGGAQSQASGNVTIQ